MQFLNHDVIGHICKFLGTPDIKNCRLVSSSWNYGATPVLKSRTRTTLNFSPGRGRGKKRNPTDLGGWNISDVVKKLKFCPVNVRLAIPCTKYNLPRPDFAMFPVVNNFKSIIVQYPLGPRFRYHRELFTKLILSASTTLEELEPEMLEDEVPLDFPPLGGTIFPKFTKFVLNELFNCDDADALKRIGGAVTGSFPNLKQLETKCDFLVAMGKEGPLPPSLTCLKLTGNLDANGFEYLLKIPPSLKNLAFGQNVPVDLEIDGSLDEMPTILYKLLKKHAPTLEELEVSVTWWDDADPMWKFPVFPALKKLTIDYSNMMTKLVFETESGHFGAINYPLCFPVLEDLSLFCKEIESSTLEAFLPEKIKSQVAPSVKELDIRIFNKPPDASVTTKIYVRLLDLFPNARDQVVTYLQELLEIA